MYICWPVQVLRWIIRGSCGMLAPPKVLRNLWVPMVFVCRQYASNLLFVGVVMESLLIVILQRRNVKNIVNVVHYNLYLSILIIKSNVCDRQIISLYNTLHFLFAWHEYSKLNYFTVFCKRNRLYIYRVLL